MLLPKLSAGCRRCGGLWRLPPASARQHRDPAPPRLDSVPTWPDLREGAPHGGVDPGPGTAAACASDEAMARCFLGQLVRRAAEQCVEGCVERRWCPRPNLRGYQVNYRGPREFQGSHGLLQLGCAVAVGGGIQKEDARGGGPAVWGASGRAAAAEAICWQWCMGTPRRSWAAAGGEDRAWQQPRAPTMW